MSDWSSDVCSSGRVEDGGDTEPGAEWLRVGGDGEHRIGGGLEQQIIDQRRVVIGERGNLGRQREHDVEIADREEISLAGFEPAARGGALAPGAENGRASGRERVW